MERRDKKGGGMGSDLVKIGLGVLVGGALAFLGSKLSENKATTEESKKGNSAE